MLTRIRVAIITGAVSALLLSQTAERPEVRASGGPYTPPPLLITAESNLVEIGVVVRDREGNPIAGLDGGNFTVLEDGKRRPLASFAVEGSPATAAGLQRERRSVIPTPPAATPNADRLARTVALFFDDVNTERSALAEARQAALELVQDELVRGESASRDRFAVFTASGDTTLDYTLPTGALTQAIANIQAHPRASASGFLPCPRITPFQAYEISVVHSAVALQAAMAEGSACNGGPTPLLFSATNLQAPEELLAQAEATWDLTRGVSQETQTAILHAVESLSRQPGERILVIASGGFLSNSLEAGQDHIIRTALHAGVVINALDAKGLYNTDGPGRPLNETQSVLPLLAFVYEESSKMPQQQSEDAAMANLAQSTGGLLFQNSNDLELGMRRLGLAPELWYQLAIAPADLAHDGQFHTLAVSLSSKISGALVQARRGYFAPPPDSPETVMAHILDNALKTDQEIGDSTGRLELVLGAGSVDVRLHFDAAKLGFKSVQGRRDQQLVMLAGLFTPDGRFVAGEQGRLVLDLISRTYERYRNQGLGASLTVKAPPGSYRLRVAVGEVNGGRIWTFSRSVQLH